MDGFRAILSRLLVLSLFLDPEDLSLSGPELPESFTTLCLDLLPGKVPPIGLLGNINQIKTVSWSKANLPRSRDRPLFFLSGKSPIAMFL